MSKEKDQSSNKIVYQYLELRISDKNGWVYKTIPGESQHIRIGTSEQTFWQEVQSLGEQGWRLAHMDWIEHPSLGKQRVLMFEKCVPTQVEDYG